MNAPALFPLPGNGRVDAAIHDPSVPWPDGGFSVSDFDEVDEPTARRWLHALANTKLVVFDRALQVLKDVGNKEGFWTTPMGRAVVARLLPGNRFSTALLPDPAMIGVWFATHPVTDWRKMGFRGGEALTRREKKLTTLASWALHLKNTFPAIAPEDPHAFLWMVSFLLAGRLEDARFLQVAGVRFDGALLARAGVAGDVQNQAGMVYHALYCQFYPRFDEWETRFGGHLTPSGRDQVLGEAWAVLLDAGIPTLSESGMSVRQSPAVARLECARGGMRGEVGLADWVGLAASPVSFSGISGDPGAAVSPLDYAQSQGIDTGQITPAHLARWMGSRRNGPRDAQKIIEATSCHLTVLSPNRPVDNPGIPPGLIKPGVLQNESLPDQNPPFKGLPLPFANPLEEALRLGTHPKFLEKLLSLLPSKSMDCRLGSLAMLIIKNTPVPTQAATIALVRDFLGEEAWTGQGRVQDSRGETVVHAAVRSKDVVFLTEMHDWDVDVNLQNHLGQTAAHILAGKSSAKNHDTFLKMWAWLDERGCDFALEDAAGLTCMERMKVSGHPEEVREEVEIRFFARHLQRQLPEAPAAPPRFRL